MSQSCSWCGVEVAPDSGFRATEPAAGKVAIFCRLEHIVPWGIQGPEWSEGKLDGVDDDNGWGLGRCAQCTAPLDESYVLLVRHRGEHRIADVFCDAGHLLEWAKAGGRWRTAPPT